MDVVRADITQTSLPQQTLEGRPYDLPDDVAHYLRDVRRLEVGDAVEIFDGTGRVLRGRLQQVTDRGVALFVEEDRQDASNESPLDIALYQAMPKRKRWRWILEKSTELGVTSIEPVTTEHAVVDIPEDRIPSKMERWEKILGSAARQCERSVTPTIRRPVEVQERLDGYDPEDLAVAPAARADSPSLDGVLSGSGPVQAKTVDVWIGPEGGFSDDELDLLQSRGITLCRLGPRILRAETAAVVAVSTLQTRLGDLSDS
jgi:16S rRNA (uracil1498-N3)-methyltransferase